MRIFLFSITLLICANSYGQQPAVSKSFSIKDGLNGTVGRQVERPSISGTVNQYYLKGGQSYSTRAPATGSLTQRLTGKPAGKSNSYSGSSARMPARSK